MDINRIKFSELIKKNCQTLSMLMFFILGISFLVYKYDKITLNIGEKIAKEVETILLDNEKLLFYLGKQIASLPNHDLSDIYSLIKDINTLNFKSLTTSYVSWADLDGKIVVSGKSGIVTQNYSYISARSYFYDLQTEPWKLKIAKLDRSLFSNKMILPTAMSVAKDGKIVGYLVLGLIHNEIINMLKSLIDNNYFEFLVNINSEFSLSSLSSVVNSHYENDQKSARVALPTSILIRKVSIPRFGGIVEVGITTKNLIYWVVEESFVIFIFLFGFYLFKAFKQSVEEGVSNIIEQTPIFLNVSPLVRKLSKSTFIKLAILKDKFEKDLFHLKIISTNYKYYSLSLNEKEKYYETIQQRYIDNISLIIDKINNFNLNHKVVDSNQVKQIREDLFSVKDNDWLDKRETTFNVNTLIEECVTFHLANINDLKIPIKKNLKNKDVFFEGERDILKNLIITILGFSIASIPVEGEIHIISDNAENDKYILSRVKFRYVSKAFLDISKFQNGNFSKVIKSYSDVINEIALKSRRLKNVQCQHIQTDSYQGEFVLEFLKKKDSLGPNIIILDSAKMR